MEAVDPPELMADPADPIQYMADAIRELGEGIIDPQRTEEFIQLAVGYVRTAVTQGTPVADAVLRTMDVVTKQLETLPGADSATRSYLWKA